MTEVSCGKVCNKLSFELPEHVKFRPKTMRAKACLGYTGKKPHAYYIEVDTVSHITPALVEDFVLVCQGAKPRLCRDYPVRCGCKECISCVKCGSTTFLTCCGK